MSSAIIFSSAVGLVIGFVIGTLVEASRRPYLGTGAIARECDEQRTRADKAEHTLAKVKRAVNGAEGSDKS